MFKGAALSSFYFFLSSSCFAALAPYQGSEVALETWRCGAPLVQSVAEKEPKLFKDSASGLPLGLKESLKKLSIRNVQHLKKELGSLNDKEQALFDLVNFRYEAPLVHRTSVATGGLLLSTHAALSSVTKRTQLAKDKTVIKRTPGLEERLYSAFDCIFASASVTFGIKDYGPVIMRIRHRKGFAWGSMYTGWTWVGEILGKPHSEPITDELRREYAKFVITNDQFEEAMAYMIIKYARLGVSIRNKGEPFDKNTILDELLASASAVEFWKKIVKYRLTYLEVHYTDDVPLEDLDYVEFRESDREVIQALKIQASWFEGADPFVNFFNRVD